MPTIIATLKKNPEDHALLHDMYRHVYLNGECYAFAIALNDGLGWPMVGLMKGDVIWHAGVRAPDGRIHDVRGFLSEETFASYFLSPPFVLRTIDETMMRNTRKIDEHTIRYARHLAETLWPELPWKETYAMKVHAFAEELEALSRKHGFWITGSVPAQAPRLYKECGDEGGYRVCPTSDGLAYTVRRYLDFEVDVDDLE
ncbi:MAG: hypothetical protein KBE09_01545 [Candidatus Pacebacteria bacterium]|nr:hypothetical protein [Candidatus Paceibacterota bacterium]